MKAKQPARGSTWKRGVFILFVIGLSTLIMYLFMPVRYQSTVSAPPPRDNLSRMSARKLQEHAALSGVFGGAAAGRRELIEIAGPIDVEGVAAPPVPFGPVPGWPNRGNLVFRSKSLYPHTTKDKAILDAVEVARDELINRLAKLEPPLDYKPTVAEMQEKYLRNGSVDLIYPSQQVKDAWAKENLETNRIWVEVEIELNQEQLRQLRQADRVLVGLRIAGALGIFAAALYAFLRLDSLTKGYLTMALGTLAILVALGGSLVLYFVGR